MKNICRDCQREIPDKFFERDDAETTAEYEEIGFDKTSGNGFCQKCISAAFEDEDAL